MASADLIEIPVCGLHFCAQLRFDAANAAANDAKSPRRFSGMAYGGGLITDHGWWEAVAFDLAGLTASAPMPLLLQHDAAGVIGVIDEVANDGASLRIAGHLFTGIEPEADKVAALADAGMPWQLSVGIYPDAIDEVQAGAVVNGQVVARRAHVFRRSRVREASFVAIGADGSTHAAVFDRGAAAVKVPLTHSPKELPMADDSTPAALAAMTAERDAERVRADAAEQQLAELREQFAARERAERDTAVRALLGEAFSAERAEPYLSMTPAQFAAVQAALAAAQRSRLPPGFTTEQATSGASDGAKAPRAPAGYSLGAHGLELHARAVEYMAANKSADYVAAVRAVEHA